MRVCRGLLKVGFETSTEKSFHRGSASDSEAPLKFCLFSSDVRCSEIIDPTNNCYVLSYARLCAEDPIVKRTTNLREKKKCNNGEAFFFFFHI